MFIIDNELLQFEKKSSWTLLGIFDKLDITFSDHETFCIHYDLFDRIQSTHQNKYFMWKFISNEPNEN